MQVLNRGKGSVQLLVPILKMQRLKDGRMLLQGIATNETYDRQGEIVDYDAAKVAFEAWNEKWPGDFPLREQHDPKKAVGRGLDIIADDSKREIAVKAFVSAAARDTQTKLDEGVLRYFSIGGQAKKRGIETVKVDGEERKAVRIYLGQLSEVSLVDSGANPSCSFTIVKSADGHLEPIGLDGEGDEEPAEDVAKGEWDEEKHPRGEGGKFASTEGMTANEVTEHMSHGGGHFVAGSGEKVQISHAGGYKFQARWPSGAVHHFTSLADLQRRYGVKLEDLKLNRAPATAKAADWDEEKHPRADDGKFSDSGGGSGGAASGGGAGGAASGGGGDGKQIANTTLQQLGGRHFTVMTGAKNLTHDDKGTLSFRLPGGAGFTKDGINHVKIELRPSDTYKITYGRIRGSDYKVVRESDGIYADQLREDFRMSTGLDTSLTGKADEPDHVAGFLDLLEKGDWDEEKHPRAADGKFSSGEGGGEGGGAKTQNERWGYHGTIANTHADNMSLSVGDPKVQAAAAKEYADAHKELMERYKLTHDEARAFLDSTRGRHLADAVVDRGFVPAMRRLGDKEVNRFIREHRSGWIPTFGGTPRPPQPVVFDKKKADLPEGFDVLKIHKPHVVEEDGKFKVVDDDGKVYGTHDDKESANKQLAALYSAKSVAGFLSVLKGEWDEEKHPRSEGGRFSSVEGAVEESASRVAHGEYDPRTGTHAGALQEHETRHHSVVPREASNEANKKFREATEAKHDAKKWRDASLSHYKAAILHAKAGQHFLETGELRQARSHESEATLHGNQADKARDMAVRSWGGAAADNEGSPAKSDKPDHVGGFLSVLKGEWDEEKHPRGEGGRFTSGDAVTVGERVEGAGRRGIISHVSPSGSFYGVSTAGGKHIGYFHESDLKPRGPRGEGKGSFAQGRATTGGKEHPLPKGTKGYEDAHVGYDKDVERPDGGHGAHVFEFDTEGEQRGFLESVGGAPHPLGGNRVILTKSDAGGDPEELTMEGEGIMNRLEKYLGQEIDDSKIAIAALEYLNSLLKREEGEEVDEGAQVELLRSAITSLKEFIASEIMEDHDDGEGGGGMVGVGIPGAAPVEMADSADDVVKRLSPWLVGQINKANAQGVHDHVVREHKAKCMKEAADEPGDVIKTPMEPAAEQPGKLTEPVPEPVPEPPAEEPKVVEPELEPPKEEGEAVEAAKAQRAKDVAKAQLESMVAERLEVLIKEREAVTLKAAGEEFDTLQKQVNELKAEVKKYGNRIVDPVQRRAVLKGAEQPTVGEADLITTGRAIQESLGTDALFAVATELIKNRRRQE